MRSATMLACILLVACSSQPAFGPGSTAVYRHTTILVTNGTCIVDSCLSVQINAQDPNCVSFAPFCGGHYLGETRASSACVLLPDSVTAAADSITLAAAFSPPYPNPGASYGTSPFVPQEAAGWSVIFDTTPNLANVPITASSKACTPATATSITAP
jgi:hypothetical protein